MVRTKTSEVTALQTTPGAARLAELHRRATAKRHVNAAKAKRKADLAHRKQVLQDFQDDRQSVAEKQRILKLKREAEAQRKRREMQVMEEQRRRDLARAGGRGMPLPPPAAKGGVVKEIGSQRDR